MNLSVNNTTVLMSLVFSVMVVLSLVGPSFLQTVPPFAEVRYHVSIQRHQMRKAILIYNHVCSGALITTIWVLTTGTCMDENDDYKNMRIHLASLSLKGGLRLKIMHVERHPKYTAERIMFNFAALQLEKTLAYGPNINTILLPQKDLLRGSDCSVTGWKLNTNGKLNNELIRTNVQIIDSVRLLSQCRPLYIIGQIIDFSPRHVFCAKYNDNQKFATEEGNPLVCHYVLWGLLTQGSDEDGKGFMIFSKIDLIRDWVIGLV